MNKQTCFSTRNFRRPVISEHRITCHFSVYLTLNGKLYVILKFSEIFENFVRNCKYFMYENEKKICF